MGGAPREHFHCWASALAHKACRDGYLVLYARATARFRDLALARADGSLRNILGKLSRVDVLVVGDWAMAPLEEGERRDFWEICEERHQTRPTILTSQVPVLSWHEQIGDATIADDIRDRLVHNAHRIEMSSDSMRKTKGARDAMNPHAEIGSDASLIRACSHYTQRLDNECE